MDAFLDLLVFLLRGSQFGFSLATHNLGDGLKFEYEPHCWEIMSLDKHNILTWWTYCKIPNGTEYEFVEEQNRWIEHPSFHEDATIFEWYFRNGERSSSSETREIEAELNALSMENLQGDDYEAW